MAESYFKSMNSNNESEATKGRRVTIAGVIVNSILVLLKFMAGIYGHSQALVADAVHSISDLFTDAVVLVGIGIGRKEPDENHPFGHGRLETFASFIVGLALIATALYIGTKAVLNIYHHTDSRPTNLALLGAGISIVLKEMLYHYTIRTGKKIKSQLIIANAWHHRSDSLSSIAVFLGVGGSLINPSWHILDSFAALLVSFFIIKVGLEILGKGFLEFTDTAPKPEVLNRIKGCSLNVNGVLDIHDLKVRISGGLYQMEVHIDVDGNLTVTEGHRIAKEVEQCLDDEIGEIASIIVHVDPVE